MFLTYVHILLPVDDTEVRVQYVPHLCTHLHVDDTEVRGHVPHLCTLLPVDDSEVRGHVPQAEGHL